MIEGHGDDLYKYGNIRANFSSNVYNSVDHDALYKHLAHHLHSIRSYPEPEPYSLEKTIAEMNGIESDNICVTSGATEAIYLIALALRASSSYIIAPTFREYEDACRIHCHKVTNIFSLDDIPSESSVIWLCNPNNPTGHVTDKDMLTRVIDSNPQHIFIIDQSYEMFANRQTLDTKSMTQRDNVLILHSMTKCFAVPGIRLGYVTACKKLIERIRSCRMPWSVNALAIEAGTFLLKHVDEYRPDVESLIKERQRVENELIATGMIEISPSDTHYMLLRTLKGTAVGLKDFLACHYGILIRDASNFAGLTPAHIRIAIQTEEENNLLIEGVKEWISTL